MKKIMTALGSAILFTAGSTVAIAAMPTNLKIGVVDYQTVFQQVPQGQRTLQQLKNRLKPRINALQSQQKQLAQEIQNFQRNAPTMSASARQSEQNKLSQEQNAFQQKVLSLRESEMKKEQAAAKTFENDLKSAINQVASSGNYNFIFNDAATPYYSQQFDVTSQVVSNMRRLS